MKKIISLILLIIVVGCSSSINEQVKCTVSSEEMSSIVTYTISSNKIKQIDLESTIKLNYLDITTFEQAVETIESKTGMNVDIKDNGESISFSLRLDSKNYEFLNFVGVPFEEGLVDINDIENIVTYSEENGATCIIIDNE